MRNYKKLLIGTIVACCCLAQNVMAVEFNESRTDFDMNSLISVVDKRSEELQEKEPVLMGRQPGKSYRISNIPVQDQGKTQMCWALTTKNVFETTLQKRNHETMRISAKHIAYSASNSFTSGSYEYGLNRDALMQMGSFFMSFGQLTNGRTPILDSQMPLTSYDVESTTTRKINVSEVSSKMSTKKINDWVLFSSIAKDRTGTNIRYIDGFSENHDSISENVVSYTRDAIKKHILNYGAVTSCIGIVMDDLHYNNTNNCYYLPNLANPTHAVTIIGWDDNYSKNLFNDQKPIHDGAYLVQNSYGSDKTFFYVSYDDALIESNCFGIQNIVNKDYYKLYQYDYQGINKYVKENSLKSYYLANTFNRDDMDDELLKEVAITSLYEVKCDVFVIPDGSEISATNPYLKTPVATQTITPGYHTIKINTPIELTQPKFTVVVKFKKVAGKQFGKTVLSTSGMYREVYGNIEQPAGVCFIGNDFSQKEDNITKNGDINPIKAFTIKKERNYNISETININTKNQGNTNNCWTMPVSTMVETTMSRSYNMKEQVSSKHMDYSTSQTFKNGAKNRYGYERQVNTEGTAEWALAYLTNGMGPVLERSMPSDNEFGTIDINEIYNKTPIAKVTEWVQFPEINKEKTSNGIKYTKRDGTDYTVSEVEELRDRLKLHLIQNGAIYTETYIEDTDTYYNSQTSAYYCDDSTKKVDHGVAIIGWDDNYSKDNFKNGHKPSNDGAYIVQNSWGEDGAVSPKFYISYEDPNVEKKLYGIQEITGKDNTETIYQYDELGRNTSIAISGDEVFGANVFTRENPNINETLKEVSISVYNDTNYEVYVNPNGGDMNSTDMQLVAKSDMPVENGYHTITFDEPINLTGSKFAVAIKYMGTDENLVTMQAKKSGAYSNITGNPGESYIGISLDGMTDITTISEIPEGSICIKAFTNKEGQKYSVLRGDANLDGQLTAYDLVLMQNHLVGLYELMGYAFETVDFNEDGDLTAADMAKEMMLIAGLDV